MALSHIQVNHLSNIFSELNLLNLNNVLLLGRPSILEGVKYKTPEDFFKSKLNSSIIHSLDFSRQDNPTYIHNMNDPIYGSNVGLNQYDFIYDGGTMEHCFDIKQYFFNLNYLCSKNGIIYHTNPIANYINHGFYSFSPCLYLSFYLKNNYDILSAGILGIKKTIQPQTNSSNLDLVFKYSARNRSDIIKLATSPRVILPNSDNNVLFSIYLVARKKTDDRRSHMPTQPIYDPAYKHLRTGIFYVK